MPFRFHCLAESGLHTRMRGGVVDHLGLVVAPSGAGPFSAVGSAVVGASFSASSAVTGHGSDAAVAATHGRGTAAAACGCGTAVAACSCGTAVAACWCGTAVAATACGLSGRKCLIHGLDASWVSLRACRCGRVENGTPIPFMRQFARKSAGQFARRSNGSSLPVWSAAAFGNSPSPPMSVGGQSVSSRRPRPFHHLSARLIFGPDGWRRGR